MLNHFHLLVQLTAQNLSRGMHWLNGQYARKFNVQYGRVGHLFQSRFKGILVERETHGLQLVRYLPLNPVRAGIVKLPEDYEWSSHRAVLGLAPAPSWLAVDDVLAQFSPDRDIARARYRAFVDAGIGLERSPWSELVGQMFLGSEEWAKRMQDEIDVRPRSSEHPREQRKISVRSMADVVEAVARTLSISEDRVRDGRGLPRQVAAWIGWNEALLTGPQIADALGSCSATTVSRLVRNCDVERKRDRILDASIEKCVSTLRRKSGEWQT